MSSRSETVSTAAPVSLPLFLADAPNPNDFSLFANGGWDGNWYVGYNTCWVQHIQVPKGRYKRAYVGAKLGRMKHFHAPGRPAWERRALPGQIYMAVASTPAWTRKESFLLTETNQIPLEPDFENALEGTGEARWFWVEIPSKTVTAGTDAYLALWSPTRYFTGASSAPIVAAAWGNKDVNSWLAGDLKGVPPSDPQKARSTPITVFEPALALKLIPEGPEPVAPQPRVLRVSDGKPAGRQPAPKIVWGEVQSGSVERAWVEISSDAKSWTPYGRPVWGAPYSFTVEIQDVPIGPDGRAWARIGAADIFENKGFSPQAGLFEVTSNEP